MPFRLSCVSSAAELEPGKSKLIVFPEYTDHAEIERAAAGNPLSVIVSAFPISDQCRGVVHYQGRNLIAYSKASTDGTELSKGVAAPPAETPVVELDDICVGVVICMDIQRIDILNPVIAALKSSNVHHKVLCIPAYMGSQWHFTTGEMPQFEGVIVALCNHPFRDVRCKSFIANQHGQMLAIQQAREAIYFDFQ